MRVLLATQPAYGHFHPMLPLARALRDAGHEVAFATSATFRPVVEESGFACFTAGLDWTESDWSTLWRAVPDEERPPAGVSTGEYFAVVFVWVTGRRMARDLVEIGRTWRPDLIVHGRTEFGGGLAAEALAVPRAVVQVAATSAFTPGWQRAIEPRYAALREALGLPADAAFRGLRDATLLVFSPPSLHDPAVPLVHERTVWFSPLGAAPPGADDERPPGWLGTLGRGGRRVVYVTLGTVLRPAATGFFRSVLEGLSGEPLDVVLTVGPSGDPGALDPPANARVERYVPQSLLLGRCDAVVSHGGFGTMLGSLEHGVPLVLVPFSADQPVNARRAAALGFARVLEPASATPEAIRGAVRSVLDDPAYRSAAGRMREEMRGLPGLAEAVSVLERLVPDR